MVFENRLCNYDPGDECEVIMLLSMKSLVGYRIGAIDNDIGEITDFYIDDSSFTVRYAVVDLGPWLPKPPVLLAPGKLGRPDGQERVFATSLTVEELKRHKGIRGDAPAASGEDQDTSGGHWKVWRPSWDPIGMPVFEESAGPEDTSSSTSDRLKSADELLKRSIHAMDGEIGTAADFIVETDTWVISYLVIHTGKWLPGRSVLVSASLIQVKEETPSPGETCSLHLNLSREAVRASPEFNYEAPVNREEKTVLYDYHGRRVREA
jgi:hypothetical protein